MLQLLARLTWRVFAPLSIFLLASCQAYLPQAELENELPKEKKIPCFLLALPEQGSYASITKKIVSGVNRSLAELKNKGIEMQFKVINTSDVAWARKLATMSQDYFIVGGPLQANELNNARNAKILDELVFFTFMPSLAKNEEGTKAWRFFPSRDDQIQALINIAKKLELKSLAALHPLDQHSLNLVSLFEDKLKEQNLSLEKIKYNNKNLEALNDIISKKVVQTEFNYEGFPTSHTPFDALFLPSSWRDIPHIVDNLFTNGEDGLVLLGNSSWEHGISNKILNNADRYALTLFPSAWDSRRVSPLLQQANDDFWVGLGYDFARFATMVYNMNISRQELNSRLQNLAMTWNIAPITWDATGIAHQNLYLLQPTISGVAPINLNNIIQKRKAIALKREKQQNAEQKQMPSASQMPVQTDTISTFPRPSYRLQLPMRGSGNMTMPSH